MVAGAGNNDHIASLLKKQRADSEWAQAVKRQSLPSPIDVHPPALPRSALSLG